MLKKNISHKFLIIVFIKTKLGITKLFISILYFDYVLDIIINI